MYRLTSSTFDWLTVNAPYPRCQEKVFSEGKTSCIHPVAFAFRSRSIRQSAIGPKLSQQVNVILCAVEFQRNTSGSPKDTANVIVKSNLILGCNQGTVILCRKDNVIEKIGVGVGHRTTLECLSSKNSCRLPPASRAQ